MRFSINPIHRHCGPWNTVDDVESQNVIDEACRQHDLAYGELQYEHGWLYPYLHFVDADQEFIDKLRPLGLGAAVYRYIFQKKKEYAPMGRQGRRKLGDYFKQRKKHNRKYGAIPPYSRAEDQDWDEEKSYPPPNLPPPQIPPGMTEPPAEIPFPRVPNQSKKSAARSFATGYKLSKGTPFMPKSKRTSRRGTKRGRRSSKRMSKRFSKRVKAIVNRINHDSPVIRRRNETFARLDCAINKVDYDFHPIWTEADCQTFLAEGTNQFFTRTVDTDPTMLTEEKSTTSKFVSFGYDESDNTGKGRELRILKSSMTLHYRNNGTSPANLKFYAMECVDDTDVTALVEIGYAYNKHLSQVVTTAITIADYPQLYPSLMDKVRQRTWKRVGKVVTVHLEPTQEFKYTYPVHGALWNSHRYSAVDAGSDAYVGGVTQAIVVRIEGHLGHDQADTSIVGQLSAGVDYKLTRNYAWQIKQANVHVKSSDNYTGGNITTEVAAIHDLN